MSTSEAVVAGIMGIGGTVVGALLTQYLRGRGGLSIQCHDWKLDYMGTSRATGEPLPASQAEGKWAEYKLRVEGFNLAENPTGLRMIRIIFMRGETEVWQDIPKDMETGRMYAMQMAYEPLFVVAFPPKTPVSFHLLGYVPNENLRKVMDADAVYFRGMLPSGKKIRSLIARLDSSSHLAAPM